jgi:KEOPS complex subunit Cgi121
MTDPFVRGYVGDGRDLKSLLARVKGRPLQLLRADRIYGADHLRHAASLAARAVAEGRARTADLATETLVYAAGERQVHKAIALLGLTQETRGIAVVAWDEAALDALAFEQGWTRDDALLVGDEHVLDAFGVSGEERAMFPRERWGELVLERVALSDVLKA